MFWDYINKEHIVNSNNIIQPFLTSILRRDYRVGVQRKNVTSRKRRNTDEFDHSVMTSESYIAAEIPQEIIKKDPTYVIGDGKTYGSYNNPPLTEGAIYTLYTAYVSRVNETVIFYIAVIVM